MKRISLIFDIDDNFEVCNGGEYNSDVNENSSCPFVYVDEETQRFICHFREDNYGECPFVRTNRINVENKIKELENEIREKYSIQSKKYLLCWNGLEIEKCTMKNGRTKYVATDYNGDLIVSPFFDTIEEAKIFAENY